MESSDFRSTEKDRNVVKLCFEYVVSILTVAAARAAEKNN